MIEKRMMLCRAVIQQIFQTHEVSCYARLSQDPTPILTYHSPNERGPYRPYIQDHVDWSLSGGYYLNHTESFTAEEAMERKIYHPGRLPSIEWKRMGELSRGFAGALNKAEEEIRAEVEAVSVLQAKLSIFDTEEWCYTLLFASRCGRGVVPLLQAMVRLQEKHPLMDFGGLLILAERGEDRDPLDVGYGSTEG